MRAPRSGGHWMSGSIRSPGWRCLRLDEADPGGALAAINRRMAERDVFTQESRSLLLPAQVTIALAGRRP